MIESSRLYGIVSLNRDILFPVLSPISLISLDKLKGEISDSSRWMSGEESVSGLVMLLVISLKDLKFLILASLCLFRIYGEFASE